MTDQTIDEIIKGPVFKKDQLKPIHDELKRLNGEIEKLTQQTPIGGLLIRIGKLEQKNEELQQQVWVLQDELKAYQPGLIMSDKAKKLLDADSGDRSFVTDPTTGKRYEVKDNHTTVSIDAKHVDGEIKL